MDYQDSELPLKCILCIYRPRPNQACVGCIMDDGGVREDLEADDRKGAAKAAGGGA